ncbi:outer membrane beta-barrel protein [Algoriphagus terrigena]|uniref:outer membrane beta-barrel protein n=1 Tax=Algoriphagus terrigena TaxID=344884 RepID=UPI00041BBB9F|nr:outer membrane beta-barrel protein [Algoriphagus terrigena]
MKKRIFALLPLVFLCVTAMAQLQKGNILLGGALNYSTQSGDRSGGGLDIPTSYFTFSPKVGIFLKDNLAVGLNLLAQTNTSSYTSSGSNGYEYKSSTYGLGPFVRMYFPVGDQFAFFGQFDLGFQGGETETVYENLNAQDSSSKIKVFQASTALGFSFFPKKWLSLDLSVNPLSYTHLVNEDTTQFDGAVTKSNTLDFGLNTSSILLGAHFFINKR